MSYNNQFKEAAYFFTITPDGYNARLECRWDLHIKQAIKQAVRLARGDLFCFKKYTIIFNGCRIVVTKTTSEKRAYRFWAGRELK